MTLADWASAAAATLLIFLIVSPFEGEMTVPSEPVDAAENDYEYWQQLLLRDGLPGALRPTPTGSLTTNPAVRSSAERRRTTSKPSAAAAQQIDDDQRQIAAAKDVQTAASRPPPLPVDDPECAAGESVVDVNLASGAPPSAPLLRSSGQSAAPPAGPQLVKLSDVTSFPTIELRPRALPLRRRAHWFAEGSASTADPAPSRAQADANISMDGYDSGSRNAHRMRIEVRLAPRPLVVRRRVLGEGDDAPSRQQPDVLLGGV